LVGVHSDRRANLSSILECALPSFFSASISDIYCSVAKLLALTISGFWLSFIAVAVLLAFSSSFQTGISVDQIEVSPGERLNGVVRLFVQSQLIIFVALGVL
jgi:hypothetical protein